MTLTTAAGIEVISRPAVSWADPSRVFARVSGIPNSLLLESQPGPISGRYSVICIEPFGALRSSGGGTTVVLPGKETRSESSPFDILRRLLRAYSIPHNPRVPFAGGAVGFLGYELRVWTEEGHVSIRDDLDLPDCWLGLYNCAAVFDHENRTVSLNACVLPDVPHPQPILERLEDLIRTASRVPADRVVQGTASGASARSCMTKADYCVAVEKVKSFIAAGDVYQVNLSHRFTAPFEADPWTTYLHARRRNPAPYAAYLNAGEYQMISSSPECFLAYDPASRSAETRPIKGTRPRGINAYDDERLAADLENSIKDRAENLMIVDLERNDLGRVCAFGSVTVPELMRLESYPTVHHLVSTVKGRLRDECDLVDLLVSCFPGGSITGAPKIRATQIIDELEIVRRNVYTGTIGFLGFDGAANLNIAIRTAVVKNGRCHFWVGGGIVADSDPETEYQETLDKGRAFFEVLGCK
jgi:para-aminobenzoate synthetase component I